MPRQTPTTGSGSLRTLHGAGVSIAPDDFGTGSASLAHLRNMPVDRIKIDRSFVSSIDQPNEGTMAIVRAIVGLGRGLGKVVAAEGIETEAQARRLRQPGCQLGQGYLYGRPQPELTHIYRVSTAKPEEHDGRRLFRASGVGR